MVTDLTEPLKVDTVMKLSYIPNIIKQNGTSYIDNKVYNTLNGIPSFTTISRVNNSEGYASYNTAPYAGFIYNRTDHLGNIREVWHASSKTTIQRTQYYASGLPWSTTPSDNLSLQPYKYNGKEFVEMHGYDGLDYGARVFFPDRGNGSMSVDPLAEKYYSISPYAYCLGNPVRLVDIDGRDPGDFFITMDAAAKDFGNVYNDNSIRSGREYGSRIYMIADSKGNGGYTYSIPNISEKGNTVDIDAAPAGQLITGMTHTHGNYSFGKWEDNLFSGSWDKEGNINTSQENKAVVNSPEMPSDIGTANKEKLTLYVATPSGSLQKYDPATGKISVISTKMPSDPQDPNKLNKNDANVEKKPVVIPKSPELFTPAPARIPYRIVN